MEYSRRFSLKSLKNGLLWADAVAERIIAEHPNEELYTTAAGISPSGVVHFGNFRDIITAHLVRAALKARGKNARLLFSWDNFDRYRKVPAGVPESYAQHIGMPLSKIPDPTGCHASYAEHFQAPFIEAMQELGIEIEFRNQTALHEAGTYDEAFIHALKNRTKIAEVLLSFMTEKAKGEKGIDPQEYTENYYPIALYSRFSGKDNTKILSFDGDSSVTYLCADTKKEETVNIRENHIVKLGWKVDWPMRWRHEKVHFEPGGHDHASPGGSYDVASVLAREIFEYTAPVFVEYKFVGIQGLGSKMSGSKGNAVSPKELLEIYEPDVLRWLYARKSPDQSFELAFNSEIYRQYDEYDGEHKDANAIPFRQAVGFGQIVQWDEEKIAFVLSELGLSYDKGSIARRLKLARNYLLKYNEEELIVLNAEVNAVYAETLSGERKEQVARLRNELIAQPSMGVSELELLVYGIPKKEGLSEADLKKEQRAFFKDVYNLLISKDAGPRLSTFLWAVDREKVLTLLNIV